tara:strand:- start:93 stop:395 length:303 start_codon:yes stop_codon:yes gene_type:complete
MTDQEKWDRGRTLLLESLYKPDTKLRGCAYNQDCFDEMIALRDEVIEHVQKMKNPHITTPIPNDEISNAMLSSHVGQYFMNHSYKSSELDNPENASEYNN